MAHLRSAEVGLALVVLGLWACGPGASTPEGVARRFMDHYYVAIDLRGARELCTGLALGKIDQQLELTRGVEITSDTRKPEVRYRLVDFKERGRLRKVFLFEGEVRVPKAGTYKKRCFITLREKGGEWKVSNFADQDG